MRRSEMNEPCTKHVSTMSGAAEATAMGSMAKGIMHAPVCAEWTANCIQHSNQSHKGLQSKCACSLRDALSKRITP